jgi:hypothetical protein
MIEPKLTFFKMQIKSSFRQSSELGQPHFSDTPEVFNSVNMGLVVVFPANNATVKHGKTGLSSV